MKSKPKQWTLGDESEKFKVYHFEAGEGSDSVLWLDLRWSIKRELFTSIRSNAIGDGQTWVLFQTPIKNHAVAKRMAFELIAFRMCPAKPAAVPAAGSEDEDGPMTSETVHVGPERVDLEKVGLPPGQKKKAALWMEKKKKLVRR